MSYEQDDPRLVYLPETNVMDVKGHCDVIRNRWWVVHPERGLIFWQPETRRRKGQLTGAAPQCNSDETITRRVIAKLYPWAEVKQVPLVLLPISMSDYAP
ncbi:hypothetical protein N8A98_07000 [Devosia neptuniae]|uniref:Uncharacterized protein n=1 Tax=Devosia neptuniae TaxID=191302 RepID=A0ABY6CFA6_9HYPH|nr:hypothetical protein [Devosia neptuniae]UXN70929.1 hypothetical protein N8A98_07000 [Devosia neptuniae]